MTPEETMIRASLVQYGIPRHMHEGVVLYLLHHVQPGDFITALLSNDLMGAFGRADEHNIQAMRNWVQFIYTAMPFNCHGSPERVQDWLAEAKVVHE